MTAGSGQGIQKAIAGIVQTVGAEDGSEAAFIEAGVMSNKGHIGRKTIRLKGSQNVVFHLVPDIWEKWGVLSVIWAEAVDLLTEPGVVVRIRMDEAVE